MGDDEQEGGDVVALPVSAVGMTPGEVLDIGEAVDTLLRAAEAMRDVVDTRMAANSAHLTSVEAHVLAAVEGVHTRLERILESLERLEQRPDA